MKATGHVCKGAFPNVDPLQAWGPPILWLPWGVGGTETNSKLMARVCSDPNLCAEQGEGQEEAPRARGSGAHTGPFNLPQGCL